MLRTGDDGMANGVGPDPVLFFFSDLSVPVLRTFAELSTIALFCILPRITIFCFITVTHNLAAISCYIKHVRRRTK